MRITFVGLGNEQLGISLLSAIAKQAGFDVGLAFSAALFNDRYNLSVPFLGKIFNDDRDVWRAIEQQKPDVVAFSPITGTYQWMLGIAQKAKAINPQCKVIFGGVHTSALPDQVLANPQVDYVCVGEGDIAFPMILSAIKQRNFSVPIPNVRFKDSKGRVVRGPQIGFIQDLDSLPAFDKTLWEEYILFKDQYHTMVSRGCPFKCTFCFNSYFANLPDEKAGAYLRYRSVGHMIYELILAKKRYDMRFVVFQDDVLTANKPWLKEFLEAYRKEIHVPFECLIHPSFIDRQTARWLVESGCRFVHMGIETMDDDCKRNVIKRVEKPGAVEQAMSILQEAKLPVKVDHMFGLPEEKDGAQAQARDLYVKYPPYRVQTFWTNFLPGTELMDQALVKGLITSQEAEKINEGTVNDYFRSSSQVENLQQIKLYRAYEVFYKMIPLLPSFARRQFPLKFFYHMPGFICSFFSFWADTFGGLIRGNPDHLCYAKHYMCHVWKFVLRKVGIKISSTNRIQEN